MDVRQVGVVGDDILRGQLVRLTGPRPDDAEILSRWSEDAAYRRLMDTDAPRPLTPDAQRERDEGIAGDPNTYEFRVRLLDDDRLLGFVAVHGIEWPNRHAWIAMGIGEGADRGRGYGEESLHLLLRYAFHELGLHRLTLDVIATNHAAIRLYQKVGFREEGRLRQRVLRDGITSDLLYMGLLAPEWQDREAGEGL